MTETPLHPAPRRLADPARNVPAEPWSDDESFRRFTLEVDDDAQTFTIRELLPTKRYPMNWYDGATTREWACKRAKAQHYPVRFQGLTGPSKDLGVMFDQEVADEIAYNNYVARERSFSDAAFYVPLSRESWAASNREGA